MIIKQRVHFEYRDEQNKKRRCTVIVGGRTEEELNGRVEKMISRYLNNGYTLR